MRRGLHKDLANTPTQIVCGWRLYGPDLRVLRNHAAMPVESDLFTGECQARGSRLEPPLHIADDLSHWFRERVERDEVPPGLIASATTTLTPRMEGRTLGIACETVLETTRGQFASQDTARWALDDWLSWW